MAAAMQPPVAVPANGGPSISARVALPAFENVTLTLATPVGSPSLRQEAAWLAAAPRAAAAAAVSKSASLVTSFGAGCGGVSALGSAGAGAAPVLGVASGVVASLGAATLAVVGAAV